MKWLSYLIFLFYITHVSAQQTSLDSNYVQDLSDSLMIKTGLSLKFTSIRIEQSASNTNLIYEPESGFNFGLGFSYKWLGLNIGFRVPGSVDSREKSTGIDLRINSYGRRLGFDLSYTSLNGFAMKKSFSLASVKTINFRPDLHSTRFTFSSFYALNPSKFSLRAITLQNERQLKSAGTPLVGLYVNHITFETKDSISVLESSPTGGPDMGQTYPENLYFKKVTSFNFGANLGYMYTLVIKKRFFTSLGINLGLGFDNSIYSYEFNPDLSLSQLQLFAGGRFAIGYNTESFYIGFFTYTANSIVDIEKYTVSFEQGVLNLVLTKRFSGDFKMLNKFFKTKVAKTVAPKS